MKIRSWDARGVEDCIKELMQAFIQRFTFYLDIVLHPESTISKINWFKSLWSISSSNGMEWNGLNDPRGFSLSAMRRLL